MKAGVSPQQFSHVAQAHDEHSPPPSVGNARRQIWQRHSTMSALQDMGEL